MIIVVDKWNNYLDLSRKILYTWQVAGVGAGLIVKAFNSRLCR